MSRCAVLFDVDGTLLDVLANQRRVWQAWAAHHALDPDEVYATALRTVPLETFAAVAPALDTMPRGTRACSRGRRQGRGSGPSHATRICDVVHT